MDGHALLGEIALFSCIVGDGGPRGFRRRKTPLPEKYMPGRFLAGLRPDDRSRVVEAACARTTPAPWFLRSVIDEESPRWLLPPEPVDRRWCRRGRWASPPHKAPATQAQAVTR
jgi:hypothetical protein